MSDMTVGQLAAAVGVHVETIRYYQRLGLVDVPERQFGGGLGGRTRRYGLASLRRLKFVRSAQAAGFTLAEIAELLALDSTKERARVHQLASRRIEAIDRSIAGLQASRAALARLAGQCAVVDGKPCPIISAFEGG